ncbi:MAG: hypothetical protein KAJ35_02425, partial [Thermoplasmata archaeon]|nr:hypothetical protein [Thermoplasmata archaeon]
DLLDGPHTIRMRASSSDSTSEAAMVNFTIGDVTTPEPFDFREWVYTWEGIIVVMLLAGVIAVVVNVAIIRRRKRREAQA